MCAEAELLEERLNAFLKAKDNQACVAINWLYTCLNTLDSKASTLLRVNGIFIALVSALALFTFRERCFLTSDQHLTLLGITILIFAGLAFALLLVSSLLCHMVARIEWPFLGKLQSSSGVWDFTEEANALVNVVASRTSRFQWAWRLSPFAILLAAVALGITVIGLLT